MYEIYIKRYEVDKDDFVEYLMHSNVSPREQYKVLNPKLTMEVNKAGSLTFTVPRYHAYYHIPIAMTQEVNVIREGKNIWSGRIVSIKEDFYKNKQITCEGALAYFNDIIFEGKSEFLGVSPITRNSLATDMDRFMKLWTDRYLPPDIYCPINHFKLFSRARIPLDYIFEKLDGTDDSGNPIKLSIDSFTDGTALKVLEAILEAINGKVVLKKGLKKNLFNRETTTGGKLYSSGAIDSSVLAWQVSDYIPAKPNTSYALKPVYDSGSAPGICFYNANYEYLDGISAEYNSDTIFVTPNDTNYIRFSLEGGMTIWAQLEEGNQTTYEEPYMFDGHMIFLLDKNDYNQLTDQEAYINFGENLLDYVKNWDVKDKFTCLIPLGETIDAEDYDEEKVYNPGEYVRAYYWQGNHWYHVRKCSSKTSGSIPDFSTSSTYAVNARVVYNNAVYKCIEAVSEPGDWQSSKWEKQTIPFNSNNFYGEVYVNNDRLTVATSYTGSIRYTHTITNGMMESFGVIERIETFEVDQRDMLKKAADKFIEEKLGDRRWDDVEIEISAVDLHRYMDPNHVAINLNDSVHIVSRPHGLDAYLPVDKIEIPLDEPGETKYTFNKQYKIDSLTRSLVSMRKD